MKTVAVICEYNPFHSGHEYHLRKIREDLGDDTAIIAVMSGNFTQRGDLAIADKALRAKAALLGGANLVLELPFPYSMSSAELYAAGAVSLIDSLGLVDILSFGSESGDVSRLSADVDIMLSEQYKITFDSLSRSKEYEGVGYPSVCEAAFKRTSGYSPLTRPNDLLALEYIKAARLINSKLEFHTVKRIGADYNEESIVDAHHQSATAIRAAVLSKDITALEYVPDFEKKMLLEAIKDGQFPCDSERLATAVISSFRLNSPEHSTDIHDASGGLYNRIKSASLDASTISQLVNLSQTKKYTTARIRRAIWYSFLGVTSSMVKSKPLYTQLLATDDVGRDRLKKIKKHGKIQVLTKPADTDSLSETALTQKLFSDRADSVFQLTKPNPPSGAYSLKFTPFVK